MSDRTSEARGEADAPDLVIPDGGLGSSMPAWLQQRPEWATGLREADTAPEAETPTGPTVTPGASRELPPPDESPIHLESILTVDDLPEWLQAIAGRSALNAEPGNTLEVESTGSEDIAGASEPDSSTMHISGQLVSQSGGSETNVHPQVNETHSTAESDPKPLWRSDGVIGGVIAAIVMILIYVILAATGVL